MRADKRKTLYLILFCLLQLGIVVALIVLQDRHWPIRGLHERKKWRIMMKDFEKGAGDGPKVCFGTVELRGPDRSGGIGATVHSLAFLLASKGFRVTLVYAGQLGSSQAQFWEKPFSEFGIRFVFLPDHLKTHSIPSTMASYKMYRWLREHEDECDIVHFHDYVGIGYFSMLAQKMGLAFENIVFQLDGHAAHAFAREGAQRAVADLDEMNMEFMERRSVELADLIVAPSQFLVDWMKKEWTVNAKEIRIIQNVLPGKPEEQSRVLNSINEIVYFGKFDKLKGIDIFLNAIDNLSQRKGIQIDMVTFIGIPMEFTSHHISQRAKKWGIPYQIYTYKDTSFAMEYLKSHDAVAVFPSRAENSPTVILESVSNGICFVASKVGGIPELIGDEWKEVHLFEPNGKDLASKLYNLLKSGCQTPLLAKSLEQTRRLQIDWHTEVFNLTYLKPKPVYMGENNSHICVVIPFYNRYSTMPDALASLQAQTYKNFEVIIVNDGSEENSVKMLESTVKEFDQHMKITVIHQENKHLSAARNTGAKSCNGDWIMFLDDDDISKPEQLQIYLKAAINIGADALTNVIDVFKGDKPGSTFDERWLGSGPSIELSFFRNNLGATANLFIKKEVFDKTGGFNEDARGFEDWEYGVRLMLSGFKLEMVPESLYWYRDSPGSMMKTLNEYAANKVVLDQYLSKIPKEFHPILKLARVLSDKELKANSRLDSWNNWYHINPF